MQRNTRRRSGSGRRRPESGIPAAGFRPEVRIVEIDLARIEAAAELWEAVRREGAAIDVLVNNAGIFSFRDILQTPPSASSASSCCMT